MKPKRIRAYRFAHRHRRTPSHRRSVAPEPPELKTADLGVTLAHEHLMPYSRTTSSRCSLPPQATSLPPVAPGRGVSYLVARFHALIPGAPAGARLTGDLGKRKARTAKSSERTPRAGVPNKL